MEYELLSEILGNLARFLAALSVALVGVYLYDWTTPFKARVELAEKDNTAVGVDLIGYVLGIIALLAGAVSGAPEGAAHPLDIVVFGLLGVVLLRLGAVTADRLILSRFSVRKELTEDRNLGVAFVTGGVSLGTGVVLAGALAGESSGLLMGVLTTLEYFLLSQLVLVAAALIYLRLVRYRYLDGSLHGVIEELEDNDNAAVGLAFGGYLVGVALVVSAGVIGSDITSWDALASAVGTLALSSVLGIGTMLLVRPFVDRAVVPYAPVNSEVGEQRNLAIGGLSAAFYAGLGALLYSITA